MSMSRLVDLAERIDSRDARIGVIGLGYVGLPLALEFAAAGFRVVGIDKDPAKVRALNAGRSHVEDVSDAELSPHLEAGRFKAQADYNGCGRLGAIFICVPTPLRRTRDPDISYIVATLDEIAPSRPQPL